MGIDINNYCGFVIKVSYGWKCAKYGIELADNVEICMNCIAMLKDSMQLI